MKTAKTQPMKSVEKAVSGDLVRYLAKHGYDLQRQRANAMLTKGDIYTVDWVVEHDWNTDIYLREYPGESFNSVMFESVPPPQGVYE